MLPVIYAEGTSAIAMQTAKGGFFSRQDNTKGFFQTMAASDAAPPQRKDSKAAVGCVFFVGIALLFSVPSAGVSVIVASAALGAYIENKEKKQHAQAVAAWEKTWSCTSCGNRWQA
jgi:hypothetical protein